MNKKSYIKRFIRVLFVFFKIFLSFRKEFILTRKKGYKYSQLRMLKIHKKNAKLLYNLAVDLGGVMIKLCQYFSTRRDMFPEPYIEILSPLQDNVPPVSFQEIESRLIEEYGDYNKIFIDINKVPLAAASLGQVHRAMLHNGDKVVLKVLKPMAERVVDIDFAILFHVFKLFGNLKAISDKIDINLILSEFIRVTGDELNFRREAFVSKLLKEKLGKFNYLKIPYIYEEISTENILVMEFCEGVKISELSDYDAIHCDPVILARRIVEIYFEQLLFIKTIHFDPHPGNILINTNNQIILLDFGMSGEITEKMSAGMKDGLKAFSIRDYRKILDILHDLGFLRKGVNRYSLLTVMEYFFDEILNVVRLDKESIQTVDLGPVIDDLIEIIYSQPFILPVEWAYIARTASTLAGIISGLNPAFKFNDEFKPFADKLLRNNIEEILSGTGEQLLKNIKTVYSLPSRMEYVLDTLDRGTLKFKVDLTEVDDRLDDLKNTIVRLVAIGIGFFSLVGAYTIYYVGRSEMYIYLSIVGFSSFFFSWLYSLKLKALRKRDFIKKAISGK
ncbi:MAG: hypothetical protein A2015_13115 [Spirochaetes bacterium GWF1_31_7]|nr:MAG: hypothetical protein A2Y30_00520 [Spirochaetes bacterium GWE1_32_154]OHD51325.1 MAG: hypothetical protein A2Y29_00965 [Spirochaetes bacterium GWE2_31_10]OHD51522.1 MAG: hypothetical protein A2015_13115 [Spirochaetes bacterium GWF1_31_7]HBD95871.1 hypothetical protein [Spirochaetia bacterium]HBI38147.1 hypothetical protein [Spirochaetia bacterium]